MILSQILVRFDLNIYIYEAFSSQCLQTTKQKQGWILRPEWEFLWLRNFKLLDVKYLQLQFESHYYQPCIGFKFLIFQKLVSMSKDMAATDSFRGSLTSNSARGLYRVGEPASYLEAKHASESTPQEESSSGDVGNSPQEQLTGSALSVHKLVNSPMTQAESNNTPHAPKTVIARFNHLGVYMLESLIFLAFLVGSLTGPDYLRFVDYGGNIASGLKILLLHSLIYRYNLKHEQEHHQIIIQGKPGKDHTLYLNRLQVHEMLQIWSILITLLCLAVSNPTALAVMQSLRVVRLFFPFFLIIDHRNKLKTNLLAHILKLTCFVFLCTFALAVAMQLLLYNTDSYLCMSKTWFASPETSQPSESYAPCGVNLPCSEGDQCVNLFSLVDREQDFNEIRGMTQAEGPSFTNGQLMSLDQVGGMGGKFYDKFRKLMAEWILLPIVLVIWLLGNIFIGIGIGESIRYDSLDDWKKMQKSTHKKQRISNISYNSEKLIPDLAAAELAQMVENCQFTTDIEEIDRQYQQRSLLQKLATVSYNLLCLTHVLLVILFNLRLGQKANQGVGIALGVIFIVWTFGLALSYYQYCSNRQDENASIKRYILIYETFAYLLTLAHYILLIVEGKLVLEQQNVFTPLSHAAISLRVMYILYNNGFDAYVSYYAEKMMQNFLKNFELLFFMAIAGVCIGFIQAYSMENSHLRKQVQAAITGVSAIFGVGGSMGDTLFLNIVGTVMKFVGVLATFYFAKHINMNYDSIFQVDFSDYEMTLAFPEQQLVPKASPFRLALYRVHSNQIYCNVKSFLIVVYLVLTLVFARGDPVGNIVLFALDIVLMVDAVGQVVCLGPGGYLASNAVVRVLFLLSQFFLIVSFFISAQIPVFVLTGLRVSRGLMLYQTIPYLNEIYVLVKSILFHPKIKIYKIVVLSVGLCVMGMGLTACYAAASDPEFRAINLFSFSFAYVYNLGWGFTALPYKYSVSSFLCLNAVFMMVVLFLHIVLTFMMVTFFVNRKVRGQGDTSDQVLKQYTSMEPDYYHYRPTDYPIVLSYVKVVKLAIIVISFVMMTLISGSELQYSRHRFNMAIANLIFCLSELFIYVCENVLLLRGNRWDRLELGLLLLSLPGTFFLVVPVAKYSGNMDLGVIVRVCLLCSLLRILRIFPLLASRGSFFSSKLFRRIYKQLEGSEIVGIFGFIILFILPFSAFQSLYKQTSLTTEFITFLTGSVFTPDMTVVQLVLKFACTVLVLFPLRTMLIARIISSFLSNKPNQLYVLRDNLASAFCDSGMLDQQQLSPLIRPNNLYRFTAQIYRIFEQFSHHHPVATRKYAQIMPYLSSYNIPVYLCQEAGQDDQYYGVFAFDVIWHIYKEFRPRKGAEILKARSLYEKMRSKFDGISSAHFNSKELYSYLKMKFRIFHRIKNLKSRQSRISEPLRAPKPRKLSPIAQSTGN